LDGHAPGRARGAGALFYRRTSVVVVVASIVVRAFSN
jgi:hypothetical protein